jgi:RES domain-containing protein
MAAFTHLNPLGSRFSDGSYGVFYCAREARTAVAETRYHSGLFLTATKQAPLRQQMRLYTVLARGEAVDLRNDTTLDPAVLSPVDYSAGQALGRQLRQAGAAGIVYPSVRDPSGECLAAFRTTLLRDCRHAAYLEYNWNGNAIDSVFELNQIG